MCWHGFLQWGHNKFFTFWVIEKKGVMDLKLAVLVCFEDDIFLA